MSEERLRILQMVSEGKLSVEEAEELLQSMEMVPEIEDGTFARRSSETSGRKAKSLRIVVKEGGKEKVNMAIPLKLAKGLLTFIPRQAREKLEDENIDVADLISQFEEGEDVGTLVNIQDGEDHVEIKVE
ncbi:MAG: SHOCT-like domain-containing protein [Bacillota bacterium]